MSNFVIVCMNEPRIGPDVMTHRFQMKPGKVLHDAIMDALHGQGLTAASFCVKEGISGHGLRLATFGLSGDQKGTALRERAIEAAGRDLVEAFYSRMILEEAATIRAMAA